MDFIPGEIMMRSGHISEYTSGKERLLFALTPPKGEPTIAAHSIGWEATEAVKTGLLETRNLVIG